MFLSRLTIIIPVYIIFFNILTSQDISGTDTLSLIFAGDIMGHDSQILSAYNDSTKIYEYDSCFKYISPFILSADIAVANLEVTLAGPPYKGYPQFSSPDELALAISKAGFDILITANNHSLDRGKKGMERTIDILDSLGIVHTGTYKDSIQRQKSYPLIFEKNNIKIAILNYTYGTNGLKADTPNVVNYIDTIQIKNDLAKADSIKPDFIIVTMHWGVEYEQTENIKQQKLAQFLLHQGADVIIGMHPHVVQPIKRICTNQEDSTDYNIVVYSLGNYISNQRKRYTDGGIMFYIKLVKSTDRTYIDEYNYLSTWVYKPKNGLKEQFMIIPANSYKKGLGEIQFCNQTKEEMKLFYEDTRLLLKNIPENNYIYSK